jgi:hypothetical protein
MILAGVGPQNLEPQGVIVKILILNGLAKSSFQLSSALVLVEVIPTAKSSDFADVQPENDGMASRWFASPSMV